MSTPMQSIPVSQQVTQLTQSLTQALVRGEELRAQAEAIRVQQEENNKTVTAIRNVLAGIQLGQQLQKEMDAEKAKEPA